MIKNERFKYPYIFQFNRKTKMLQASAKLANPEYQIIGQPLTLPYKVVQLGLNDDGLGKEVVARTNEKYRGNEHVELNISSLGRNKPIG